MSDPVAPCTLEPREIRLPSAATARKWNRGRPLPESRDELRATTAAGRIYIAGGLAPRSEVDSVRAFYAFDPRSQSYRRLPDLPEPVDHAAVVSHGDSVYVIGGYTNDEPTDRSWRYSIPQQRWDELPAMPTPRGAPAGAAVGNELYVTGGTQFRAARLGEFVLPTVEIFDLATGRWRRGPDMHEGRHHHGAATLNGRLYAVGGRGTADFSMSGAERLDPRTGTWERLPQLPQGSGGLAVVAGGGRVIAISGGDDDEGWVTPATWALDPVTLHWTRLPDLRRPRHGHAAAAAAGGVFVFGGAPCPGIGDTSSVERLSLP